MENGLLAHIAEVEGLPRPWNPVWVGWQSAKNYFKTFLREEDADFIAHARQDVPALIAQLTLARQQVTLAEEREHSVRLELLAADVLADEQEKTIAHYMGEYERNKKLINELEAQVTALQQERDKAEVVFQAVVYAFEGKLGICPEEIQANGMVQRALKFRAAEQARAEAAEQQVTALRAAMKEPT